METNLNIALAVNRLAGAGRAIVLANQITAFLQRRNLAHAVFADTWPDSFEEFSEVWIVGGDGTLSFFLNKYPEIKLPLALFAGGSGNDFHWMLYGNAPWEQQLNKILDAPAKPVDAGRCNGRIFMNSTGAGFDGAVVKSLQGKAKKKGKGSFFGAVIKKIFTYKEHRYRLEGENIRIDGLFLIVSIMNGKRAGGGFFIAPSASVTDGKLDLTLIKKMGILQRLLYLPVVEKGRHGGKWFNHQVKFNRVTIVSDVVMEAQLDGEFFSDRKIEIEVLPGKFLFKY